MALIIRLRQQGRNNTQSYRLVLTNERYPRDGKYIEKLGWYNPFAAEDKNLHMDKDRVWHWLDHGALISDRAKALLKRYAPDVLKAFNEKKLKKFLKTKTKAKKAKA